MLIFADTNWLKAKPMWRASSKSGYPTLRDDWFHLEPQGNEILQLNNKNLCGGHRPLAVTRP